MSTLPEGIDVYRGDGVIDWSAVAGSGRTFAFAKSSEGMTITDANFATNWAGMRAAGLCRGAYHFGRPNFGDDGTVQSSAQAQAQRFFDLVGPLTYGDLPPTLDLETAPATMTNEQVLAWISAFLIRGNSLFKRALILYVGSYWRKTLGDPLVKEADQSVLWTARYSSEEPIIPRQWTRWTFWQYTDGTNGPRAGAVPGVDSPPDQNVFNGTLEELRELAGIPRWPGRNFIHPATPMVVGDDVRRWQARMKELGYSIVVDGIYGPQSQGVAKQFQSASGLTVDGIVGPKTWAASFK